MTPTAGMRSRISRAWVVNVPPMSKEAMKGAANMRLLPVSRVRFGILRNCRAGKVAILVYIGCRIGLGQLLLFARTAMLVGIGVSLHGRLFRKRM